MAGPQSYQKRPRYFACQFVRLLTKKCVANELGPQVFTLLTVVVHQEDARGYTDPVIWYNHQLMALVGAASEDTLDRIRNKAVKAGWLHYSPGRRGVPGSYFVTVPERYKGTDDAPTDEGHEGSYTRTHAETTAEQSADTIPFPPHPCGDNPGETADTTRGQVRGEPGDKCGTLIPVPSPVPSPKNKTPQPPAKPGGKKSSRKSKAKSSSEGGEGFVRFWDAYPHKVARPAALKAWRQLDPDDAQVEAILAGVERYKSSKPEWQAWKYPGPWLNARRWEDEEGPPPVASAPASAQPCRAPTKFEMDHGTYSPHSGFLRDSAGKILTNGLCRDPNCEHCKPRRAVSA